jgi:hypothetical protein
VHRKARRLAQFGTRKWFADPWLIGHPQGSEGTRVSGIALHPLEPPLAERLRTQRIDHCDRDGGPMECRGDRDPIVAAGFHDHPVDRAIAREPALELSQASAIRAEAQDRLLRDPLTRPTDRRDVLPFADVDADAVHP